VNIEVRHVGVFRLLFTLVRLVDQDVETIRFDIPGQNALKLLLMQPHYFLNRLPKRFEKLPGDFAIAPGTTRDAKKLRLGFAQIHPCPSALSASTPGATENALTLFNEIATNIYFHLNHLAAARRNCPHAPCYGFRRG
jgi:hypothetical protein